MLKEACAFDKTIKENFINIMIFDCIWPELIEKNVMNASKPEML